MKGFRYCRSICDLAHDIIARTLPPGGVALDATLGKGTDTRFLLSRFEKVYAFDIQESAIAPWRRARNPKLVLCHDSHANVTRHVKEPLDCAMYNLGYLPGSDKAIVTKPSSTLESLAAVLGLLKPGGLMTIAVYLGHPGGPEEGDAVSKYLAERPFSRHGIILHRAHNRSETAPCLYVVENKPQTHNSAISGAHSPHVQDIRD